MPIGILEGFDIYPTLEAQFTSATEGSIGSAWNVSGSQKLLSMQFVTGLGGQGKGLYLPTDATAGTSLGRPTFQRNFSDSDQLTLAWGATFNRIDEAVTKMIALRDNLGNHQFDFGMSATGKMQIRGEGDAILATSTTNFNEGQTYRFNATIDAVALNNVTTAIKVNGEVDDGLSGSGLDLTDFTSSLFGNFFFQGYAGYVASSNFEWTIDDLVLLYDELLDLPPLELFTMAPTADILAEWTRLTGATNFSNVDEIPFTQDTDYNYDTVVGHKDIFQFGALPRVPEFILAVSPLSLTKKDEVALRQIRNVLRVGGVDYPDGVDYTQLETYSQYFTHYMNNPATAVPWVAGDFPLRSGYELRI